MSMIKNLILYTVSTHLRLTHIINAAIIDVLSHGEEYEYIPKILLEKSH